MSIENRCSIASVLCFPDNTLAELQLFILFSFPPHIPTLVSLADTLVQPMDDLLMQFHKLLAAPGFWLIATSLTFTANQSCVWSDELPQPALEADSVAEGQKHLFILSGQSNMAGLDPNVSFTPSVQQEFGSNNVIVVKLAQSGQPIRRWYRNWKSANGTPAKNNGDLYDRLIQQVKNSIEGKQFVTVSFVWMQGERDAKTNEVAVYGESLKGLVNQLHTDLKRNDINVVIGKLGKGQLEGKRWSEDWAKLRKVQEDLCKENPRWEIVDCDDLEMKSDKLHFTPEGYKGMGQKFAETAIRLIRASQAKSEQSDDSSQTEAGDRTNQSVKDLTNLPLEELKIAGARSSRFTDHQLQASEEARPQPNLESFHHQIQPILNTACVRCHGPDAQEGNIRIDTLNPNLLEGSDVDWWLEILAVLSNGEMPPPDEAELTDDDRVKLIEWLSNEIHVASVVRRSTGEHSSFRRMTRYEYNYALQDILGLPWNFAKDLPPEANSEDGFQNSSELLHMSVMQLETYLTTCQEGTAASDGAGRTSSRLALGSNHEGRRQN